ncbi:MAG: hydrolase [Parachlamydia sp.]|jgi:glutamate carboxypeptidase|nr:hydrolase [Parachlamydia sp.]
MNQFLPFLNWIENQADSQRLMIKAWAEINTFSTNVNGILQMTTRLLDDFKQLDGQQTLIDLPSWTTFERGQPLEKNLGPLLRIIKRPSAPIQVLLGGHMDTVFSPSSPFQSITERGKDSWVGPGLTDMKGGLGIMLIALAAFERAPISKNVGWEILINPDEEIGSPGSTPFFKTAAKNKNFGLLFEPSFSDGTLVSARKGSSVYTIIFKGRAAHAGRDFKAGSHAIYALSEFIHEVEQLNEEGRIVNVGSINGGGPVNIVPDFSTLQLNMRSFDEKEILNFSEKLQMIAKKCEKREGVRCTIVQESKKMPKPFTTKTRNLFSIYHQCARMLGLPFEVRETGGVCDGNTLAEVGLPCIDSLGAQGGGLHTSEEYILLPSLVERAQLTALALLMIASGTMRFPRTANG